MNPLLWTTSLGPAGPLDQLSCVLTPRGESHGRCRPHPPPGPLLLLPRVSPRYQSRLTATPQRLREVLSCIFRFLLAIIRQHLQSYMPLTALLNCSSLIPSRVTRMPTERTNRRLWVNQYILLRRCPRTILLSDNGLQFCSKVSQAVYQLLGVRKLATNPYHPNVNGGVERVNNTMAQMLAVS